MASATNNWNLFGLDLTRSAKWLSLGVQQLLYDRDAWLLKRFDPGLYVHQDGLVSFYVGDTLSDKLPSDEGAGFQAVVLSPDTVLLKTLHLPASTEESLGAAMEFEVGLSSPFSDTETRAAWRVVERRGSVIEVALGITAQSSINQTLADHRASYPEASAETVEVWALTNEGAPIPFTGFGGGGRRSAYHHNLTRASALIAGLWLAVMLALTVLAGAASVRADRLETAFQQVRQDARSAAAQRERLQVGRTRLNAIETAVKERPNYQYWLNHIAASAPDTVYFDRLNFEKMQVIVNGYSDNAAVYLRMLTEEPGYTDVTALSAFSRDRNNGLERFSIQWQVTEPPELKQASPTSLENPDAVAEAKVKS